MRRCDESRIKCTGATAEPHLKPEFRKRKMKKKKEKEKKVFPATTQASKDTPREEKRREEKRREEQRREEKGSEL